jgi:hypothetical protein
MKFLNLPTLPNLSADPTGRGAGDLYFNTVTNSVRYYTGAVWQDLDPTTKADAGWFKIAETVLGASATTIDFSSIPGTYKHLRILAVVRSDVAATSDSVNLVVNNDTTNANYDRQQLTAAGTTVAAAELLAGANARIIAACPAASSPASHFGSLELTVFDYTSTSHFKMVHAELSYWAARSTGGLGIRKSVMGWASTAAITRLTLSPFTGPNFVSGSMASLYGIKAAA